VPRTTRRMLIGLVAGAITCALALPALAANYETLDPTDQADGRVWSIVHIGGIAYLGGEFSAIVDHGGGSAPRDNLAAINLATGNVLPWNPGTDGPVYTLATDGTTIFAGGDFKVAAGQPVNRLAAITASGSLKGGWNGRAGYIVRDLAVGGTTLYVGGDFAKLNGVDRTRVGALSTVNGTLLPMQATIDKAVRSLALSPAGDKLFLGGYFEHVNGSNAYHTAAIDPATGSSMPFNWHPTASAYPDDMQANGDGLFIGFAAKGTDFHGIGSYTLGQGNARWVVRTCGDTQDIELQGDTMYIGGHLRCVRNIDLWPIKGAGAVDQDTGDPVPWNVTANIGCGQGCLSVWDLTRCGTVMCVGGDFTRVIGDPQAKFAVLV
jgi:hypothetical protein